MLGFFSLAYLIVFVLDKIYDWEKDTEANF